MTVATGEMQGRHPAPARGHVAPAALWFGIFGGPAAWTIQTLVDLPLASHACFPRLEPLARPVLHGMQGIVLVVSLLAVAVSIAAGLVAWRSWSRTRAEQQEGAGKGSDHDHPSALLETGEGRTRFMALCGVLTSIVFVVVTAAQLATVMLVAPCGN